MIRICLLVSSPFTKSDYKKYGISNIKKLGFKFLVLDCTPFLEAKFYSDINGGSKVFQNESITTCYSKKDIFQNLNKFNPDWCIDDLGGFSKRLYLDRVHIRFFIKNKFKLIEYQLKSIPFFKGLIHKDFFGLIKNLVKINLIKILSIPWKIAKPDKVVVGGLREFIKLKDNADIIQAHNFDYDNFRWCRKRKFFAKSKYNLVFLDEDFPCHSDYLRDGVSPSIDEEEYFEEISNFLINFASRFKLKPIIKLHPKANFSKSKRLYKLPVSMKDTAKLISQSDVVIAHCSTSIQLAVLFKKPLILIIPNQLKDNSVWKKSIDNFSRILKVQAFRTSEINKIKSIPTVNIHSYNKYEENFIKMQSSPDQFSWEIITKNL